MVSEGPVGIDPDSVVVLIPVLNEAAHIVDVLGALVADDRLATRCRIIIADGGSTDATCGLVEAFSREHPNIQLVHNPGRTQAAAMNMLLADHYRDIEIILRCDAHAAYPSGFVSGVVACLVERNVASVVIPMDAIAEAGHCFQRGLVWIADTPLGAGGAAHRGGMISGYCTHGHHAAFRMADFRRLGGYDTRFQANEDAEYDHRLLSSGGRIWLSADHRIGYFPRRTPKRLWAQYYAYGAGRAQTCLKHRIRPGLRQLVPALNTALLILSLACLPFSEVFLVWPLFYGVVIVAAGLWMAIRHRSFCGLAATPALAAMHLAWGLGFWSRLLRVALPFPSRNRG